MGTKPGFRIKEIVAIIVIDRKDDSEGVPAVGGELGMMPLLAADKDRLKSIYAVAVSEAEKHGFNFRVVRFSVREDITEETKQKYGV